MHASSFYVTTPIYYVNGSPHLGHFYTTVAADIFARFAKLEGKKVKFLTGTDEYGAKVAQAAEASGQAPQAYVDEISNLFREMTSYSEAKPDDFIRTTEPRHHIAAQALWKELEDRGQIYLSHYAGWYALRDETFYDEKELTKTPSGQMIAPSGASVEWTEEPCYFFRLSHWQEPLLKFYEANPHAIAPESRRNETLSFIRGGLWDLAISRSSITWGIPVPGESSHVMYVWLDALTNYISALGYPDRETEAFQTFWPHALHLVGKDILRFHTVYWPAFLMAAGLPLPKRVFAHGWWTSDGEKMSKSLGNVIDPKVLVETYGADRVRYFLFRHVRFGQDGDFSKTLFIRRVNTELADEWGNLAHRVLSFVHMHCGGKIPRGDLACQDLGVRETHLITWARNHIALCTEKMEKQDIYAYLQEIMQAITQGNQIMTQLAPWELVKHVSDPSARSRMEIGLSALLYFLRDSALLLWPVMPQASEDLLRQIGALDDFSHSLAEAASSDGGVFSLLGKPLSTENVLPLPNPLFSKLNIDKELQENRASCEKK